MTSSTAQHTAAYVKMLPDESYEFGFIEQAADRRKDKMVRVGERPTYAEACAASAALAA